jgi:molybdate transport system permease protein
MLDFTPFLLSIKLAAITTVILFLLGVPLAYWLASSTSRYKIILEAIVALPLVLPPTVLGFYLLLAFSPQNMLGSFLDSYFDLRLVFTFPGLVIASVIYSLPFMVQPVQSGFSMVSGNLIEASYTLGKSRWTTLRRVLIPNSKGALLSGCILSFVHTIGEFGVILMVGGNIPNQTRTASIAIYDEVEAMNYHNANTYSLILLAFSFIVLVIVNLINHRIKFSYQQ